MSDDVDVLSFHPVKVQEVEISRPLPVLSSAHTDPNKHYAAANIVARLHGVPLGIVTIPFTDAEATASDIANAIWSAFGDIINQHLVRDRAAPIEHLSVDGLPLMESPPCQELRRRVVEKAPLATICIRTHDRTAYLRDSMPMLMQQTYPNFEVLVVDNAPSSGETRQYIEETYGDDPRVHYVVEPNPNLAWASNAAVHYASGEIIAFIDDDAYATPDWLAELMAGYELGDNIACVTGLVLPKEFETPAQLLFEQFGGLSSGYEEHIYDLDEHRYDHPLYPYLVKLYGAGANMSFRTKTIWDLGGFDLPVGQSEDIVSFVKVVTSGYQLVYRPQALVYHIHRRDYAALQRQMYQYGVGLTMSLVHFAVQHPLWLFRISPKIPHAIWHVYSPTSPKNKFKEESFPKELSHLEHKGMLYGPIKYLKSWWKVRGRHPDLGIDPALRHAR